MSSTLAASAPSSCLGAVAQAEQGVQLGALAGGHRERHVLACEHAREAAVGLRLEVAVPQAGRRRVGRSLGDDVAGGGRGEHLARVAGPGGDVGERALQLLADRLVPVGDDAQRGGAELPGRRFVGAQDVVGVLGVVGVDAQVLGVAELPAAGCAPTSSMPARCPARGGAGSAGR